MEGRRSLVFLSLAKLLGTNQRYAVAPHQSSLSSRASSLRQASSFGEGAVESFCKRHARIDGAAPCGHARSRGHVMGSLSCGPRGGGGGGVTTRGGFIAGVAGAPPRGGCPRGGRGGATQ